MQYSYYIAGAKGCQHAVYCIPMDHAELLAQKSELAFGRGARAWAGRCGKLRSVPACRRGFCPISKPGKAISPSRGWRMWRAPSMCRWLRCCRRRRNDNPIVALVGLRGAGKSTIGKALAKHLGVPFAGTGCADRKAGESVARRTLFAARRGLLQASGLRHSSEAAAHRTKPMVIATGGSIVTDPETWQLLKRRTHTVWLKATPEDHWKRVLGQGDTRPMANRTSAMTELRSILSQRSPLYAEAAQTIDTSSVRVSEAVRLISSAVRKKHQRRGRMTALLQPFGITDTARSSSRLNFSCILLQYAISLLQIEIANNYDARRKTTVPAANGRHAARSEPGNDAAGSGARHPEGEPRIDQPVLSFADRKRHPPASDQ